MARFAVLNKNNVVNIIVADSLEIAETVTENKCVEIPNELPVSIGDVYSLEEEKFIISTVIIDSGLNNEN